MAGAGLSNRLVFAAADNDSGTKRRRRDMKEHTRDMSPLRGLFKPQKPKLQTCHRYAVLGRLDHDGMQEPYYMSAIFRHCEERSDEAISALEATRSPRLHLSAEARDDGSFYCE